MKLNIKIKKKFVIFLFIYFTFFTSFFTMRTLSRYISVVRTDGEKTIAKWDVVVGNENTDTINLVAGNNTSTQNYILSVTSNSETKVGYSIILSNVPNDILVSIDGGSNVSPTNNKVEFSSSNFVILATDTNKTKQHTIKFTAPIDAAVRTNRDISVDLIFTQEY